MRTALYLRVSTIHQKPDLQADSLRRYAIRAGLEIVAEYLDVAISGRKEGRPQLQALMRAHAIMSLPVCLCGSSTGLLAVLPISSKRWRSSITSGFALSVCRIRWTRRVRWARRCLR